LRYHLEREVERNVGKGMSDADARDQARRALGNLTLAAEDARASAQWRPFEEARQDVLFALRAYRRAPTFVIGVIGTIGLGLGLLAAAFTLFDAYVLRTMPVRDPTSLYETVWHSRDGQSHGFTWSQFNRITKSNRVFSSSFAMWSTTARLRNAPAVGELVSGNYFDMLGVPPALGRILVPEDAVAPGSNAVVVLSYAVWKRTFGADSSVIGKTIPIGDMPFTIVGVARQGFTGLGTVPLDFWVPATMSGAFGRGYFFGSQETDAFHIVGRVPRGSTSDATNAALLTWLRAETAMLPTRERVADVVLIDRGTAMPRSPQVIELFAPILAAFGLVLLIACANVANLMLARGMTRQREIGIRLSLGADRRRVIRQLLNESLLLAIPAALCGLLVSRVALEGGPHALFATLPPAYVMYIRIIPLDADALIVVLMMVAAVVAAVAFGLVPALQSTRTSIVQASKGDFDTPSRRSRLSDGLAVVQICLSVVLMICAGVLLRTARESANADPGIKGQHVVQISLPASARPAGLEFIRTRSDLAELASAMAPPLDGSLPRAPVKLTGRADENAAINVVSPEYFSTLGVPMLDGRAFTNDEAMGRVPVAIVSRSTASKFWPGKSAVGQLLDLSLAFDSRAWLTPYTHAVVIGVVGDVVPGVMLAGKSVPMIYYPQPVVQTTAVLLARVTGDPNRAQREIERGLAEIDPGGATEVHTVESMRQLQAYPFAAAYWVASIVGVIALVLTLTGVYGVLSYLVEQRRKELGIRSALGATQSTIMGLVLSRGARLALVGIVVGVLIAWVLAHVLAAQLIFKTNDVTAYIGGAALVFVACLIAAYVPSRRAANVDPLTALRAD
jgi:predicted permease